MHLTSKTLSPTRFSEAAAAGLRVFPVSAASKKPALAWKEFQERAASQEELASWDSTDLNVGVVCGAPSDLVVLDLDSPEAVAYVEALELPPTPTVRTGRGFHLYFRRPSGGLRNAVRVGGLKMDVRGDGGYVVGAGSVHESGATYEWTVSPQDVPFAEFPTALLHQNKSKKSRAKAQSTTPEPERVKYVAEGVGRFLAEALSKAQTQVADAAEGGRNDTLFRVAANLARHYAGASADWPTCHAALEASAMQAGLEPEEIHRTLESAWSVGSAEPVRWLTVAAEHVYLGAQDLFYHPASDSYLKRAGFEGSFADRYSGKGPFVTFLLDNGYIQKAHDITYRPLEPRGLIELEGVTWLNTFRPSAVVAEEGDASPFVDFMTHLVPDEAECAHLLKMIAFTVRNPGHKIGHALLLRTREQGVGKSMMTSIWAALLGEHNARKTTSTELDSDYQGFLPGRLLIVCEELNLGKGLRTYNNLKDLITGTTAVVNEKFLRQRIWPNFATFVFLTNIDNPILIEDRDRRFFYIDSPAGRREPAYYTEFDAWWRANLGVIRHHLDQIDLSDFHPFGPPPMTQAKQQLIECSRSELAQDLALAIADRIHVFDRDIVTLDQVIFALGGIARGKSRQQITKALQEIGAVPMGQHRVAGNTRASLWVIRNTQLWPYLTAQERAEEFARSSGLFAQFDLAGITVAHADVWSDDVPLTGLLLVGEEAQSGLPQQEETTGLTV